MTKKTSKKTAVKKEEVKPVEIDNAITEEQKEEIQLAEEHAPVEVEPIEVVEQVKTEDLIPVKEEKEEPKGRKDGLIETTDIKKLKTVKGKKTTLTGVYWIGEPL